MKIALRFFSGLMVIFLVTVSTATSAADYPRRIAIAPFTILGSHEEIRQTVEILPRLLSSRLMAMTGAEVLLLSPAQTPHADTAKRAGMPLLLNGSVTKLGEGYSIDLTVSDLTTGTMAGAFFIAANTQDDIIPRLGDLAADVSEKIFGVKAARAYASPPPAPAQAAPPSAAVPVVVPAPVPSGASGTAPAAAGPALAAAPKPQTVTPAKAWVPSSFERVGQSDKIPDEIYGVVAGDVDEEGNAEVIAYGKYTIYIYRVKGKEIVPYTRVSRPLQNHFLGVDAVDLDGDGRKEILVTNLADEQSETGASIGSFVLKRKGDVYEEVAEKIPYFLVVLPDWMGKPVVAGQREGFERPFRGPIFPLHWEGKGFSAGEPFPQDTNILPLSQGIPGLSSARFGKEWKMIYTDETSRIRILDADGKPQYASNDVYGSSLANFVWGPIDPLEEVRKKYQLRKAVRVAPNGAESPLVLIPEVKKGLLGIVEGFYDSSRLVLLQWEEGDFVEKAGTSSTKHFISGADFLSPSGLTQGDGVLASVIEQSGNVMKDKISRLVLYRLK